ncbi:YkoF family thiamine/hydroxymethylpyrimidine-binding protein [Thermoflexibacter ruber]|uniref:Thiamine-binding protein n=1 Tax=Thermoflexibacter ruber TaxID=1003 RepID=A0A1I2HX36_9BACT|nr:YkoF family thiamine/hydroxymethylpyrimidine-binding protein [Thermoflexibacter ruber]SFF34589.1 Thiamine-binding protein [Thermoflexibacter ruber]
MKISVEISLYPLSENYEQIILDFIANIRQNTQLEVITNGMSTQIFGEINQVMTSIEKEMTTIYEKQQAVLVMKMGRGELKYKQK